MSRISDRISEAVGQIVKVTKCPACGERVVPVAAPEPAAGDAPRWSFIWTAPAGDTCPKCAFPLARYARRLKWLRLLQLGIIILTLAAFMGLAVLFGNLGPTGWVVVRVAVIIGGAAFLVGVLGTIVGGRRS